MSRQGEGRGGALRRTRRSSRLGRWLVGFAFAALLLAAPSSATFHLMKIREVYPAGNASYVVMQLMAAGEFQVGGHHFVSYNADGSVANDFTMPGNVSATSRNNSAVLIAGSGYAAAFPGPSPTPDATNAGLNLSPAGGAVCWVEGEPPDCVAWGNFTGPLPAHTPPFAVGSPASPGGVTAGKALNRSMAAGCATILEESDDTDSSAADFSEQAPNPRSNSSTVPEKDCDPPVVEIHDKPANPTRDSFAKFVFESDPPGAAFECKLDSAAFAPCVSDHDLPVEYTGLADGSHTFRVQATNTEGTSPAVVYTWLVDTQAPTTTIKTSPANPSSGEVEFTYEASQLGTSFECSLSGPGQGGSFSSCPVSGLVYSGLADGSYTFSVKAKDKAGNQGAPASYSWAVKSSSITVPPVSPPSLPPLVTIPPVIAPKPTALKCKKGFVKKKVKGKARCVKKPKKKKKK